MLVPTTILLRDQTELFSHARQVSTPLILIAAGRAIPEVVIMSLESILDKIITALLKGKEKEL